MAQLIPPSKFFRVIQKLDHKKPGVWHVLWKIHEEATNNDQRDIMGWPDTIITYRAACGMFSLSVGELQEFRPAHDVPYKQICKGCWPYMVEDG